VAGLALAFRRRSPLGVFLLVTVLLSIPVIAYGSSEGIGPFAALLVALYTVGAYCDRLRALAALGVFSGYWLLLVARDPLNHDVGDMLGSWPVYLLFVIAWLAGGYVRTRRLYLDQLRHRADEAEAAQAERVRFARADERRRIARELHDAVAHSMTVMVMQAEAADEVFGTDPEAARQAIERVQATGREGLAEMRRLVGILRDDDHAGQAYQPGLGALSDLVDSIRGTGLVVEVTINGTPQALPTGLDISAYRIVQEALTNVIKHAHARSVSITVMPSGGGVRTLVEDDGTGLGLGLVGMRERVGLVGGRLEVESNAGTGTTIVAEVPLR